MATDSFKVDKTMKGNPVLRTMRAVAAPGALLTLGLVAGCGTPADDQPLPANAIQSISQYEQEAQVEPKAGAGVKVEPKEGVDIESMKTLVASRTFGSRSDPFALLAVERKYDDFQSAERLLQGGGFMVEWVPPAEKPPEVIETQPYRRLAGVMVGESVLAIIDMGDGHMQIVRPGQQVPGTEWTVVSIDPEKAILRRSGNKKPKEVIVPLAGSIGGLGGTTSGRSGGTAPGGTRSAPGAAGPSSGGGAPAGGTPVSD